MTTDDFRCPPAKKVRGPAAATAVEQLLADMVRVLQTTLTLNTRTHVVRWRGEAGNSAEAATAEEEQ